ncbi:MAG: trypsin-like serine protease [Planctomycetota bacterium]
MFQIIGGRGFVAVAVSAFSVFGIAADAPASVIRDDVHRSEYRELADRGFLQSVGQVITDVGFGSGTLIKENWVLTAAHVVDFASKVRFKIGNQSYRAKHVVVHEKWDPIIGVNGLASKDLALIRLSRDVASKFKPAKLNNKKNIVGMNSVSAGFGRSGTGSTGMTTGLRHLAGQNVVDATANNGRVILSDFDDPINAADSSLGDSKARDLEALIGSGDSGGGLFVRHNKGWRLAGVHSFGSSSDGNTDSDYGDVSGHVSVAFYRDWIKRTIQRVNPQVDDGKFDKVPFPDPISGLPDASLALSLPRVATDSIVLDGGFTTGVPEPATTGLLAFGGFLMLARGRRSRLEFR